MPNTVNIYVNKADIGLNNVDNTSDLNKPISTATQTALNGKENVSNKSTNTSLGTSDQLYPTQNAVKTYVDNSIPVITTPTLDQVTTAGNTTNNSISVANPTFSSTLTPSEIATQRLTTSKKVSLKSDGIIDINTNGTNTVSLKATNLTHDITLEMPAKNAGTYTIATTDIFGAANGLAQLDGAGKVPSSQLPSYVDDVVEYANLAGFPVTGESGKIYIALDTNLSYRWGGTTYVEISPSLALGETSTTAYRGDRGKTAYDHSQTTGNPHGATTNDIPDSLNKRYVTDANLTVLSNTSGTNTGNETTSTIGALINGSASATPNDSDLVATVESSVLKNITWTNVKAFLKTYFDTIYTTTSAVSTQISTALVGYATQSWVNSQGFITNVDNKADKNITLNRQIASYVAVAGDNGKLIEMNVASANTLTINTSIFSAGNQFLVSQYGAGQTTITAGAGVTLRSNGAKLKTSGQYALVTIIAISSTEFYVAGDLTA
jgi:hypothetical protein